jgi:hypothetical protein
MSLVFEEAHAAPITKRVNEEYFVLLNTGATPIRTSGLNVVVSRPGKRGARVGQLDPGFVLQPGERILLVTGVPGKKSMGEPPAREGMRVYYLFSHAPLLAGRGTVVRFAFNDQVDAAKLIYDPSVPSGVGTQG